MSDYFWLGEAQFLTLTQAPLENDRNDPFTN